jgi:hypothetical protein
MGDDYIELWRSEEDNDLQRTAYVFHEICWALLMEQCGTGLGPDRGPGPLNLDRLFLDVQ